MSDADDRKRIRREWLAASRSESQIANDEAFGRLERLRDADAGWNVIPIVAPASKDAE